MLEPIHHDKIRIIKESTEKQLLEIAELKKSGAINEDEAETFQEIIIDVLEMQKATFCA